MAIRRRALLQTAFVGLVGANLLPRLAWAEEAADPFKSTVTKLFGSDVLSESDKITVKAPEIAENGASVPVDIAVELDKIEEIALIAPNNPAPFVAKFSYPNGKGAGNVSTRIKMGQTGDVIAVVKADGQLYYAAKEVKVTIGGCGG
jgi:sulfur-oxidizing protein SoxY